MFWNATCQPASSCGVCNGEFIIQYAEGSGIRIAVSADSRGLNAVLLLAEARVEKHNTAISAKNGASHLIVFIFFKSFLLSPRKWSTSGDCSQLW